MLLELLIPLLKHFGDTARTIWSSEWSNIFLSVLEIIYHYVLYLLTPGTVQRLIV